MTPIQIRNFAVPLHRIARSLPKRFAAKGVVVVQIAAQQSPQPQPPRQPPLRLVVATDVRSDESNDGSSIIIVSKMGGLDVS